ncbi:NAD-dependent epimerase/dehydratase family protein [Microbacterium album]|uniref:Dihydroflavonol-4-reductase n=1 Tax=Microbacterium album TaxID=2053191 RepID=A0A917MLR8_9MICO|nr:NAD-dependent epimerase/dehydratase family protein [Microbacterium album]GGH39937.1 dihydroflavonol-4-reductase [Microbacterium album]
MSETASRGTVLVTGGTGYLAGWLIVELLNSGYRVRASVRDTRRAEPARQAILERSRGTHSLQFVQADLLDDEGWESALDGVEAVLHTASPMPFDHDADLITSAREGTRRILTTAARVGVRRVVFTSSGTAARSGDPSSTTTEHMWSEPSGEPLHVYPDSKIYAERLAWELADELGLDLTAVLPSFMQGPPVGAPGRAGTIDVIRRLLNRAMPALPRLGWNIVDVRDEARLHVLALGQPAAIGERYNGSGTFLWYRDVARILREGLPEAKKIPTRQLPDFLVRLAARRDPHLAMIVDELGIVRTVDSSKARRQLGWTSRDVRTTILDTARALLAHDQQA